MEVTELEHFLLGPEDADICMESFAESTRDEGGGKKFVKLDSEGGGPGAEVADAVLKINGADHLWTARGRAELSQQEMTRAKYPELIPEFDAIYTWTSRDRVVIERMAASLARERQTSGEEIELLE